MMQVRALAKTLTEKVGAIGLIGFLWVVSVVGISVYAAISPPPTPPSPESLAQEQAWREHERERRDWEKQRANRIAELGAKLKNLGYDVTVQEDDNDRITITSAEFSATDGRVRFLALLRGKHSPMVGPCDFNIERVRLRSGWFGFSEVYELNCFSIRLADL